MTITVTPAPTAGVAAAYARIRRGGVDVVESLTPTVTVQVGEPPTPGGMHAAPGLHLRVVSLVWRDDAAGTGWAVLAPRIATRLRVDAVLTAAGWPDRRIHRLLEATR